jgi:hypothetical protein
MTESTFETAKRCPRCQQPGRQNSIQPAPERHMGNIHIYSCANDRCDRAGRTWIIQVRPDGSIPEPTMHRDKSFPMDGNSAERIARSRARMDEIQNQSLGR